MKKTTVIASLIACVLALSSCANQVASTVDAPTEKETETSEATAEITPTVTESLKTDTPEATETSPADTSIPTSTPTPTPTPTPTFVNKYDGYAVVDFDKSVDSQSSTEVDYHIYGKGNSIIGPLAVVSKNYGYNSKYTSGLVTIREDRNSSIGVSVWGIQCTPQVLAAIDRLNQSYETAFPGSDKTLMVSAGFAKSTELGKDGYSSEYLTGNLISFKLLDSQYTYNFDQNVMKTERQWMLENCYKFGFVQRYSSSKEETTGVKANYSEYRYVGVPHSYYMNQYGLCLEEYTEKLRSYSYDSPLCYTDPTGDEWQIYYVACAEDNTYIPTPKNSDFSISGDNQGGFIVTVKSRNVETIEYSALISAINKLKSFKELKYVIKQDIVISQEQTNSTVINAAVKQDSFYVSNTPGSTYVYKDGVLYCTDENGNTISSEYAMDTAFSKYCPLAIGHTAVATPTEECLYLGTVSSENGVHTYKMTLVDNDVINELCTGYFNRSKAIFRIQVGYRIKNSTLVGYFFEGYTGDGTKYIVDFTFDTSSVVVDAPAV